jgi:hypothetical protein
MPQELINRSDDLKKLLDERYDIKIIDECYALIDGIPYLNNNLNIKYGSLVSNLSLNGERTIRPNTHVIYFIGEYPCNTNGSCIESIRHSNGSTLTKNLKVNFSFSNKPRNGGYNDYYEKFIRYIEIITAPPLSLDNSIKIKTTSIADFNQEEYSVFCYTDTNSSNNEITYISQKLKNHKIAIIGLGGTGSYVLDFVSKTPVKEIRIIDGDNFSQHNAFRAPGAPTIDKFEMKKTDYFYSIYSNIHKNIINHKVFVTEQNIDDLLKGIDFVFINIDSGKIKKTIIDYLLNNNKCFVDLGIGIEIYDNKLIGQIRTTFCTPEKNDHLHDRISLVDREDDEYSSNIQIAELNALNAILGIIKWKKMCGFYQDLKSEFNSIYTINTGALVNECEI